MRRSLLFLLLTSLAVSCSTEITEESQPFGQPFAAVVDCTNRATVGNVAQHWGCNSRVYLNVQTLSAGDRGVIEYAAQIWNAQLHNVYPQLPRFSTDPATPTPRWDIPVTKNGTSSSTWCGTVTPEGIGRPTAMTVGTTSSGNRCGDPYDVAIHEMAHIAGFSGEWHTNPTLRQHCAFSITTGVVNNVNTNGGLCQLEIEIMLALYGVRLTSPNITKSFITKLNGPTGPSTLQAPNTATLGYTSYGFGASNGTLCGKTSRQMCSAEEETQPVTGSLDWTTAAYWIASVAPTIGIQTTVSANSGGSTTITAKPRAVSAYDIAFGTSAARPFTVTAATPPPPDASIVGNYTSATNTIKSSQTCRFMAFPAGATYAWSRMNSGSATWTAVGNTREIVQGTSVSSFQLRVVVTNASGSDTAILGLKVSSTGVICDGY